ncbi:MAG: tRNA pseudouridine(55) synthase TruB [Bacillota bacterium]
MHGILNIHKEKGYTSHDVVAVVRRILHTKKVGHTGTLDPDATGVLPICVGKATKLSDLIMDGKKTYVTTVFLGKTTTTEDASGEVLEEKIVDFDEEKIREVVQTFIGEIEQIPPMYSAIKVNGKKLYELAREGVEIERKKRKITIHGIEILEFLPPNQFVMKVDCSKGTYIRTLCADIGKALGFGAYMATLERTATGTFSIDHAVTLGELENLVEGDKLDEVLLSMETMFSHLSKVVILEKFHKLLCNGAKLYSDFFSEVVGELSQGEMVTVFDYEGNFIGLYHVSVSEGTVSVKPFKMLVV